MVATNTLALQDQLVNKDIPQVQAMLAVRPPGQASVDPNAPADPLAPAEADGAYEPPALQAAVLKGAAALPVHAAAARVADQPRFRPWS